MENKLKVSFIKNTNPYYSGIKKYILTNPNSPQNGEGFYVEVSDKEKILFELEIRENSDHSTFQQVEIIGNHILIGLRDSLYIFHVHDRTSALYELDSYFSEIYLNDTSYLVCSGEGILCFNNNAEFIWERNNLGIDGIIINEIKNGIIFGQGEWDPPGGWRNFSVSLKTGVDI